MKSIRAFTLIELLIVVAIIAILAAIAVPNFLEAQVRSKVSRAKADMRSMATAIEAYTVDYNRPPAGMVEVDFAWGIPIGERHAAYSQLTTPVAYVTSIMEDPFGSPEPRSSSTGQLLGEEARHYYFTTFMDYPTLPSGHWTRPLLEVLRAKGYFWALYSVGPDRDDVAPWTEEMLSGIAASGGALTDEQRLANLYDTTNGTQSVGNLYRTSKGIPSGGGLME